MEELSYAVLLADPTDARDLSNLLAFVGERRLVLDDIGDAPRDVAALFTDTPGIAASSETPVVAVGDHSVGIDEQTNVVALLSHTPDLAELLCALHAAQRFREQRRVSGETTRSLACLNDLVGASGTMCDVRDAICQAANKDATVLITGESGTGKEIVARCLHEASDRKNAAFVPINCGAIPSELLESELFGYERGAFTGAVTTKRGRFELADGGTLFLDEIGDMPLPMQVKLLRALQEKSFERLGGTQAIGTNVRIVAATHRDLHGMIAEGSFREDLFFRLNVFPIDVPALRDRPEDLPDLIAEIAGRLPDGPLRLTEDALATLAGYTWPGNVRELANLVERLLIQYPGRVVGGENLPPLFRQACAEVDDGAPEKSRVTHLDPEAPPPLPVNGIDLKDYLNRLEKSLIKQALDDTNLVVARAADRLHIRRTTLVEKMRKYGLSRSGGLVEST